MSIAMDQEEREILARDYTATVLWGLGKLLGRDGWTMSSYIEMAYPEIEDKRSAEQIKRDLVKRLMS